MLGLVLCGGQSSRMGSDKGMLMHSANTWAQTAFNKLGLLDIPVKLSVNNEQLPAYKKVFEAEYLVTDNTLLSVKGPALGVLSAHLAYPNEDLFLLACDLLLMDNTMLSILFDKRHQDNQHDAFIFTSNNEPEPLCGIYTARGLDEILAMYQQNKLTKYSMKFVLDQLVVTSIPIQQEQQKYFQNFNAHAELNGLK